MKKKFKIAIIGSRGYPYVYSGYETLVKELSERLIRKGHKVRVYCHSTLFKKKPRMVNGIELIYTPSIETKFLSQIINSFFSFIHACFSDFDIILVVNSANGPFGIFTRIFNKKTCINVDGLEWLRPKWKGLGSVYFKISSWMSVKLFNIIITDSNEMNEIYQSYFKKKSYIIAYGSTMVYTKSNNNFKNLKISKKKYYLIVGRLIPDNNADIIINGFINSNTKKKLLVVGDVPYSDKYADQVKSYASDKIIFTGYINDQYTLSKLYRNCYGYIHGHEFGGTNPTMINALSLNSEVMALDTVFNREMLNGKDAVYFKKNKNSIVNSFNKFEKEFQIRLIKNKKYKLGDRYSWEKIINQYEQVFKKLGSLI